MTRWGTLNLTYFGGRRGVTFGSILGDPGSHSEQLRQQRPNRYPVFDLMALIQWCNGFVVFSDLILLPIFVI